MQVGNAVTDGREIVVGLGSMQIINAALFAFSNRSGGVGHSDAGPRTLPRSPPVEEPLQ
jgi:hypothetical protein